MKPGALAGVWTGQLGPKNKETKTWGFSKSLSWAAARLSREPLQRPVQLKHTAFTSTRQRCKKPLAKPRVRPRGIGRPHQHAVRPVTKFFKVRGDSPRLRRRRPRGDCRLGGGWVPCRRKILRQRGSGCNRFEGRVPAPGDEHSAAATQPQGCRGNGRVTTYRLGINAGFTGIVMPERLGEPLHPSVARPLAGSRSIRGCLRGRRSNTISEQDVVADERAAGADNPLVATYFQAAHDFGTIQMLRYRTGLPWSCR